MSKLKVFQKAICLTAVGFVLSSTSVHCDAKEVVTVTQEDREQKANDYLHQLQQKLEEIDSSQPIETTKKELEELTCTVLAFFYGETEYSWNDLSEDSKALALSLGCSLLNKIEIYEPEMVDAYQQLYVFLGNQKEELWNRLEETMEVEEYNQLVQTKDKAVTYVQEKKEKVKTKIRNWYDSHK